MRGDDIFVWFSPRMREPFSHTGLIFEQICRMQYYVGATEHCAAELLLCCHVFRRRHLHNVPSLHINTRSCQLPGFVGDLFFCFSSQQLLRWKTNRLYGCGQQVCDLQLCVYWHDWAHILSNSHTRVLYDNKPNHNQIS